MKYIKNIIFFILMCLLLSACGNRNAGNDEKLHVMATVFPIYDVCREVAKGAENVEITWLLDNGVDLHNFNPTADDIINIGRQDLFFYIGGESDKWVDELNNIKGIKYNFMHEITDLLKEEEIKEGMEEEIEDDEEEEGPEYDEHIWLSLNNIKYIAIHIEKELSKLDPENCDLYEANLDNFLSQVKSLDESYKNLFDNIYGDKVMLFADRFPFRYMCDDYGIDYYAAFMGCSAETEASFKTIKFLTDKVDELKLDAIWVLEGSDKKIAETIVNNAKNKNIGIYEIDSMQSVNKKDSLDGESYINIMNKNYDILSLVYGK